MKPVLGRGPRGLPWHSHRALLWGPASILFPFHYTHLILAALAGYLAFCDVPSVWTWAGAAIIIGSGLHIVWRETTR